MHLGISLNPNRFSTDVFHPHSFSEPGCLSYDTISPLTPPCQSPSDSTSLNTQTNNQDPTSPALTPYQSQSDIMYSCDSMFSSYENFGRSDLLNSSGTNINTGFAQPRNSESEVESSVDKIRSSCVLTDNATTIYNSNLWINNLTGKHNSNDASLSACNQTSHTKRALDLEPIDQEFTQDEAKKIMANEKLAELALVDPKRVKR